MMVERMNEANLSPMRKVEKDSEAQRETDAPTKTDNEVICKIPLLANPTRQKLAKAVSGIRAVK